jgi:hypothetical protein
MSRVYPGGVPVIQTNLANIKDLLLKNQPIVFILSTWLC